MNEVMNFTRDSSGLLDVINMPRYEKREFISCVFIIVNYKFILQAYPSSLTKNFLEIDFKKI